MMGKLDELERMNFAYRGSAKRPLSEHQYQANFVEGCMENE